MKDIDFWVDFVAGNSNKLQKVGLFLEGKISWSHPQCVHIANFKKFSILKMWKIKNVFTLGPMAQATLVAIRERVGNLGV